LRELVSYLQNNHGNDLAKLLASGFEAVSTNRASTLLVTPSIKDIVNGMSCQLVVRIGRIYASITPAPSAAPPVTPTGERATTTWLKCLG